MTNLALLSLGIDPAFTDWIATATGEMYRPLLAVSQKLYDGLGLAVTQSVPCLIVAVSSMLFVFWRKARCGKITKK